MAGQPRPLWGWHRLDKRWANLVVADANIQPCDLVLDIGAGSGALTAPLVAAGARIIAVELHHARATQLRNRFRDCPVTVVQVDARDLRLPKRPFRVVANPPFAVTMAIVRRLLSPGSRLVSAHLVVPRYVASRWVSQSAPGRERWARTFTVSVGRVIPRQAFMPRAPRDSVTVVVHRRVGH